jgi:N-acetylglucosaminyl-diphospho-decaprenol L-rhamnosyltransferase
MDLSDQVTVVVITHNRVKAVLKSLWHLSRIKQRVRIVVVDNNSTDKTVSEIRKRFPQVTLVTVNENTGPVGRNVGVALAHTPYIAFSDDDSWWETDAFEKAVKYFESYPKLGLMAAKIIVNNIKIDPICRVMANGNLPATMQLPGPSIIGFLGCAAIVRRDAFWDVGGFNYRFGIGGEESIMALDLIAKGWGLAYVDDLVAHHHPSKISRDRVERKTLGIRNWLWLAWMRRPITSAVRETIYVFRHAFKDREARKAFLAAVSKTKEILKQRKQIPNFLERQIRQSNFFRI